VISTLNVQDLIGAGGQKARATPTAADCDAAPPSIEAAIKMVGSFTKKMEHTSQEAGIYNADHLPYYQHLTRRTEQYLIAKLILFIHFLKIIKNN